MRVYKKLNGLTVNAISGTYIVFLGLNIESSKKKGLLGFAIQRTDHKEGETEWLRGMKSFENIDKTQKSNFSTLHHPIQGFQWSDYTAKPDRQYTYRVVCMYGKPENLIPKGEVSVTIKTENTIGDKHSVFFNCGSVASQEYARRFGDLKPSEVGTEAYKWLSRGLLEALLQFIQRAKKGDSLHGAIYEFQYGVNNEYQYGDILIELKNAAKRGVIVKILYDDIEDYNKEGKPTGPWERNRLAIAKAKIKNLTFNRSNGSLMHNKFLVLSSKNKNIAVWTGSTNLTENGIFGHSNLGHIVEDEKVATSFLDYWHRLLDDPKITNYYRDSNMISSPIPILKKGTTAIFSPRGRDNDLEALNWYSQIANSATKGLFMTFAFGMHENFSSVYNQNDGVLRMGLMENKGISKENQAIVDEIRKLPNTVIAIGNNIKTNSFDKWLAEIDRIISKLHIKWIHTKYMLVDPLSNNPIVITGSANFSKSSTIYNDENMIIIQGDKRIADIYFCEYIRLYSHYAFRESVKRYLEIKKSNKLKEWRPQYLSNNDSWLNDYFVSGNDNSARKLMRLYFSNS